MKQVIRIILIAIVSIPVILSAKNYTITHVQIESQINSDGTVSYAEHRTYAFDGEYTWANYALPKSGFSEITDVQVSDENRQYTHDNTEKPGTFQISTNSKEINIKWYYSANSESKTFTIRFIYHDAIAVGPIWSQFQSIYISNRWKKTTQNADILLKFPRPIATDSIYNWIHGISSKTSLSTSPDQVTIQARNITSSQYLQVRTLFPSSVLQNVKVTSPKLSLSMVQADEKARIQHIQALTEKKAQHRHLGILLTILIAFLSALVWILFFQKFGKRFKPKGIPKRLYDTPTEDPPAIAGYIVQYRSVSGSNLIATLFDLARRGYFRISQEQGEGGFLKKSEERFKITLVPEEARTESLDELNGWELDLYDYVTDAMEDDNVYFDDLTDQRSMMRKWFNEWAKSVKDAAEAHDWYDKSSLRAAIYCGLLEFVLLAASIVGFILAEGWGLIGFLTALIFGLLTLTLYRRTPEGEKVYRQWKAFKESLKEGHHQRFDIKNIDKLFVYAIAVGLGEKQLSRWLTGMHVNESAIPWIVFAAGTHASPAEVAASMSTLAATGLQTVSSVAGTGGATAGSSVGGAGGGAG